jgi:hypothetical protein
MEMIGLDGEKQNNGSAIILLMWEFDSAGMWK